MAGLNLPFPVKELSWERFEEVCERMTDMSRADVAAVLEVVLGEPPEHVAP